MSNDSESKRKRKPVEIDPVAIFERFNACSSGRKPPQARHDNDDDDDGDDE